MPTHIYAKVPTEPIRVKDSGFIWSRPIIILEEDNIFETVFNYYSIDPHQPWFKTAFWKSVKRNTVGYPSGGR